MRQGWAALLGVLAFLSTVMSGCAAGADAADVLGRGLLAIPFFFAAGWLAGRWVERIRDTSAKAKEPGRPEMSESGVEGEAR